jgi:hypothetical protein
MFWRKRNKKEPLPWYRAPNYKGNLAEDEKRELDSFRHQAKGHGVMHPAATYSDLPEEVGSYIRCRPECGWNWRGAISGKLRVSDQAARSIG